MKNDEDIRPNQASKTELPIFSPLDLGFFQNPIIDDETFDVIILVEWSDTGFDPPITESNKLTEMEASEVPSNSHLPWKTVRFDIYYFYKVFFNNFFCGIIQRFKFRRFKVTK